MKRNSIGSLSFVSLLLASSVASLCAQEAPAPARERTGRVERPAKPAIDPNAKSYMLVVSEFVTSNEIMEAALASKTPYESLLAAVKSGKAEVKSYSGGGVLNDTSRSIQVSSQVPIVMGIQRLPNGQTNSSVSYRDIGVSVSFSLNPSDDAKAIAKVNYRHSGQLPGPTIDGVAQPLIFSFQGDGALKIESGVPCMLVSGEAAGDESHRPRAVFVRATW